MGRRPPDVDADARLRVRTGVEVGYQLAAVGRLLGFARYCPLHRDRPLDGPTFHCRGCELDRREKARRSREAVRKPPDLLLPGGTGRCRLCARTPLPERRRSWCGDDCEATWHLALFPAGVRAQLLDLHGWRCWECDAAWSPGERPSWWEPLPDSTSLHRNLVAEGPVHGPPNPRPVEVCVDHVRPLWSLSPSERWQLRWWLPSNLQVLCVDCHRSKTAREATERAALRRGELPLDVAS